MYPKQVCPWGWPANLDVWSLLERYGVPCRRMAIYCVSPTFRRHECESMLVSHHPRRHKPVFSLFLLSLFCRCFRAWCSVPTATRTHPSRASGETSAAKTAPTPAARTLWLPTVSTPAPSAPRVSWCWTMPTPPSTDSTATGRSITSLCAALGLFRVCFCLAT